MLYYPWEVSFVMHHYHATLMKNWVVATLTTKKEGRNPLFYYISSLLKNFPSARPVLSAPLLMR